jgi:hypothetical protein
MFSGYSYSELRGADTSIPEVIFIWKLTSFIEPVLIYLIPALLFARIMSPRFTEWLHLNKPIRIGPAVFVILIILMVMPLAGFLYDWNCTWGIAKESAQDKEYRTAISRAIIGMPNFTSLPIGILLFAAIPAIARMCFFLGVLQNIFVKMLPKAPWIAIIITSVIFSASYFDWKWFVPMMLIGFQLGTIYYLSGNLWLSILGHFIFISVDWVESYLYQRGFTNEDPLQPSPTAWYTAFSCLIITAGLLWYIRKRIPRPVVVIRDYQTDIESIGK